MAAASFMALSAASFAELSGRFPVAAGEAAYARIAFGSDQLARLVGLLVVAVAVVSAAAISVGSAGYLSAFIALPLPILTMATILAMGGIAAWGVRASVSLAGTMTIIEIGGLLLLILAGVRSDGEILARMPEVVPSLSAPVLVGLLGTTLLAVFAFVGFEGLANVAEEVRQPQRNLPRAIFLTLAIATGLYVSVVWIAVATVDQSELAQSSAPLALVFERLTGASPLTMSLIAVVATLNGIIVQIIMASRVLYGLARQHELPPMFAKVSPTTRTPLIATGVATGATLILAMVLPLGHLADATSRLTLVVFLLVNISLAVIKRRTRTQQHGGFVAPTWVPWAGAVACAAMLLADAWTLARTAY
jgi:amino acid transporter